MKFYGESYDAYHVFVRHCVEKFYTKNLEKVGKIMNYPEYLVSSQLNVCFHYKRSEVKYLDKEKNLKNL